MTLLIKRKQDQPKCAYCKDLLSASVYICDGCQTYYHTECLSELGKCAILGCEKPFTGQIANYDDPESIIPSIDVPSISADIESELKQLPDYPNFEHRVKLARARYAKPARRGPELHPKSTSNIKGTKSGLTPWQKVYGAGTVGLAVATFIATFYFIIYGLLLR